MLAHPRSAGTVDRSRSGKMIAERYQAQQPTPAPSPATLIVAPRILISQWIEETQRHAPSLKVLLYENHRRAWQRAGRLKELCEADVVFTTYDQLRIDIKDHTTHLPSPLLGVFWWRICLDEAQMVCDTSNKAAIMASELWRVNGWCVTGTPLSNGIQDLHGLLVFLDHDPFADHNSLQRCVVKPYEMGEVFQMRGLLPKFLWRHEKKDVAHELEIPQQKNNTITIELSEDDRKDYHQAWQRGQRQVHRHLRELIRRKQAWDNDPHTAGRPYKGPKGVSTSGVVMSVMTALRQMCCHSLVAKDASVLGGQLLSADTIGAQLMAAAQAKVQRAQEDVNSCRRCPHAWPTTTVATAM